MKLSMTLGLISLALISCGGELSYKRGASPQALSATKNICKNDGSKTEEEVKQCLEKHGWSVHQLNDLDLFAVASVSDNRTINTADIMQDNPEERSSEAAITEDAITPLPSTSIKNETDSHAKKASSAPAKPVKKVSLLKTYVINSWWKIGSSANLLTKNTDECIATLGPQHTPNAKTQTYTRGFVICMHKKGWKALRSQ